MTSQMKLILPDKMVHQYLFFPIITDATERFKLWIKRRSLFVLLIVTQIDPEIPDMKYIVLLAKC